MFYIRHLAYVPVIRNITKWTLIYSDQISIIIYHNVCSQPFTKLVVEDCTFISWVGCEQASKVGVLTVCIEGPLSSLAGVVGKDLILSVASELTTGELSI